MAGIGSSAMAGQNMGLGNLVGAPGPGGRGFLGIDADARRMMAMGLMQGSMSQPVDGPLSALSRMMSMYAAGKTTTDANDAAATAAEDQKRKEAEAAAARQTEARATLETLGRSLYGGAKMEGMGGLIGADDPHADLLKVLNLRADLDKPKGGAARDRDAAGWTTTPGHDAQGNPVLYRINPRTGEQEVIPGVRPINKDTGMPFVGTDPLPSAMPAEAPDTGGFSFMNPGSWFGGGSAAATPVAPAPSPAAAGGTPSPRPVPRGPASTAPSPEATLRDARAAIARGAPAEAVHERLRAAGIDPSQL